MVSEQTHPSYERALRHITIEERAEKLVGDAQTGNVEALNGLLKRMEESPDTNQGAIIELEFLDDFDLGDLSGDQLALERGFRMEVNLRVLQRLYELYGCVDMSPVGERESDSDEFWLTTEHQTDRGFIFKEIMGYAAGHIADDFTPDTIFVTAEAIRQPSSDHMRWR